MKLTSPRLLVPPIPLGLDADTWRQRMADYQEAVRAALRQEYGEIFLAMAVLCALGALVSLALGGRDDGVPPAPVATTGPRGHMSENFVR